MTAAFLLKATGAGVRRPGAKHVCHLTVTYHILLVDLYYFSPYPYLATLLGWALQKIPDFIITYTFCSSKQSTINNNNYLTPSITLLMRRFPCLVFRIETPYKLKKRG